MNAHLKLVLAVATVFSLMALPGSISNNLHFPRISQAWAMPSPCPTHGSTGVCSEFWYPAGAAMDVFQASVLGSACEYVELTGGICGCPSCPQGFPPFIDLPDSPAPSNTIASFNSSSSYYLTAPIGGNQFPYLSNWQRVVNSETAGIPNFYTWLNMHSSVPAVTGTIRQGLANSGRLNPYIASSASDFYLLDNIYDSLNAANPLSSFQLLDWMTAATSPSPLPNSQLTYTPPSGTTATYRLSLRTDLFFQDGRKVTAFDVAFSYLSLKANGAFQASGIAPMTGMTVLNLSQLDLNLNGTTALSRPSLTSLSIMPGRYWTNAGALSWDTSAAHCGQTPAPCYPSQYTLGSTPPSGPPSVQCSLQCAFPASNMNADASKTSPIFDPLSAGILIGSGPWECVNGIGVVGTGCSSSETQSPLLGGNYTLTRFGKGLAPATSVSGDYFRSSGNLALWIWSGDNGDLTHDFLNFSHAAFCLNNPSPTCQHLTKGIGAGPGGLVGLAQISIIARFVGVNWISPFSFANPPVGMGPFPPVLYAGSVTLDPASVAGCSVPYPTGGYDC